MGTKTSKNQVPAVQRATPPANANGKAKVLPPADGWHSGVIIDLDDNHLTRSGGRAIVFEIAKTGSRKHAGYTQKYYITEEMHSATREDGKSRRMDIIERFGVDAFEDPDFFLDLMVRFHQETRTDDKDPQAPARSSIVSVYPQTVKADGTGE